MVLPSMPVMMSPAAVGLPLASTVAGCQAGFFGRAARDHVRDQDALLTGLQVERADQIRGDGAAGDAQVGVRGAAAW